MNKDKIRKIEMVTQRALYSGSNRTKNYFEIQNHQIFNAVLLGTNFTMEDN